MVHPDAKLAELIAMSGRATQGNWKWWMSEQSPYVLCVGDDVNIGELKAAADSVFVCELIRWFRETYT